MVSKVSRFISRVIRTLKAVRQCWLVGGVKAVNIAQIQHGEILKGKRVLVTGGSAGIGLAIAKKCLSEGAIVVITGRDTAKLERVRLKLENPNLHTLVWDAGDISVIDNKLQETANLIGGNLDVLVNNAGVLLAQSFFTTSESIWDQTYAVNSKGLFFLSQKLSRNWIDAKVKGKIVNIASSGSIFGATFPYRMTKWDVAGLTHGLGKLVSPHGIIVNGIAPGRIATGMLNREDEDNFYDTHQPVERIGLPEEVAELAIFLMSDAANYIVGQTIVCDGGYTLNA